MENMPRQPMDAHSPNAPDRERASVADSSPQPSTSAGRTPTMCMKVLSFVIPGSDSDSDEENATPPQQAGNADNNDGPVMQISGDEVSDVDFNSEIDSDDTGLDEEEFYDRDGSPDTRHRVDADQSEPKNSSRVAEILNRDYDMEVVKIVLPPVSERLAKTMSDWLQIAPNREKVKECFSETASLMPENIEGLKSVKINELLYQKLPFKAKVNDQRIRVINSYFTRGTGPLIAILDNLIDFEVSMKTYTVADPGFSPGGGANSQNCYYFSHFCRKLHENERIWTPRGGRASLAPPLGSANGIQLRQ